MNPPIAYPLLSQTGRLGNQLWEIASTIGIARTQGADPVFPLWDYQPYFRVPEEMFREFPGPRGREVIYQDATRFVPHMDDRAKPYLQDYGLWSHVADEIREYFEPSEEGLEVLAAQWADVGLADLEEPVISVHVRRGDNVTHPEGYHPLRSMGYYSAALDQIHGGTVAVFTDDHDWCLDNFEREVGHDVSVFYEGVARPREYADRVAYESAPVLDWIDLQLMAACDRHVISNSTYAWWGAFLSDDPAPIYPSNWFGWRVSSYTDASLMFPANWVEIHDPTMGGAG